MLKVLSTDATILEEAVISLSSVPNQSELDQEKHRQRMRKQAEAAAKLVEEFNEEYVVIRETLRPQFPNTKTGAYLRSKAIVELKKRHNERWQELRASYCS